MKFVLYMYFAVRSDWIDDILKHGLEPKTIPDSEEKGILLFFDLADAEQHCLNCFGEEPHVLRVNCTGLEPTAFEDFFELRDSDLYNVSGRHTFFTKPIDAVRIRTLLPVS